MRHIIEKLKLVSFRICLMHAIYVAFFWAVVQWIVMGMHKNSE